MLAGAAAALNIHGDQDGFTMRTFEACGVGGLQLIDRADVTEARPPREHLEVFGGPAELTALAHRGAARPALVGSPARRRPGAHDGPAHLRPPGPSFGGAVGLNDQLARPTALSHPRSLADWRRWQAARHPVRGVVRDLRSGLQGLSERHLTLRQTGPATGAATESAIEVGDRRRDRTRDRRRGR